MLKIKLEREQRGLTRAHLAALANLHPAEYGKLESGRLKPYPVQIKRLARALGVPGNELFEEVQEEALPDEHLPGKS